MIETGIRPENGFVTRIALLAVSALMIIFSRVAVKAALFKYILEVVAAVAVPTLKPGVCVYQEEARLGMIKANAPPCGRRMTILAHAAVGAGVHVVNGVAAGAAFRRRGEIVVTMTVVACDLRMIAGQRVARPVVIELYFQPARFRVAAVALRAQPTFVNVMLCVATPACRRCIPKRLFREMAIRTARAKVRTAQDEIGPAMVEET